MGDAQGYEAQLAQMQSYYPAIAADLISKGWQVVWAKQNKRGEWAPLPGTTGSSSAFPTNLEMPDAATARIAFRPPEIVKVLDVDHYAEKLGRHTIERAEEELGELPLTWKVTSRGADDKGGRYLFRYEGPDIKDSVLQAFADPDTGATCVDIVRTQHRFSWAPGDINPKNGELVQCFDPAGNSCAMPRVEEIPWLPEPWTKYFEDPPKVVRAQYMPEFSTEDVNWWLYVPDNSLGTRPQLQALAWEMLWAGASDEVVIEQMLRTSVALDLSRPWTRESLLGLIDANTHAKIAAKAAEWQEERDALANLIPGGAAYLTFAAEQAQREYVQAQELATSTNRALVVSQLYAPAPGAGDISAEDYEAGHFSVDTVLKTVIAGDHPFDPQDSDDQGLAEAVLDRMQGARYCADSGQWIVWGREKWAEIPGDLIGWVIAHLAKNMPFGNAKPDDEDPEGPMLKRQFKNRAYLRSTAGARAVAAKCQMMLAMPGQHPIAINRSSVDADAYVVWGGGRCWDIRKSVHMLAEDRDAIGDPHLMTATCAPEETEIPGFWALVQAILPDPASREFWLDMMARGMVGVQTKRTIPLAVGDTGMGKTLLLERMPFGTYLAPVSGQDLLGGGDREEARRLNVLVGVRLPYIDEGIGGSKYTMGRLKKITSGGTKLPARGIFGKEFEFRPVHTLVMLVNPEEEPAYTDEAVKSRICRVHFNGDIAQIKSIAQWYEPGSEAWERETPGVLAFFIRRAAQILASRTDRGTSFAKPESVKVAQDGVAGEQDIVLDWILKCTEPVTEPGQFTDAGDLFDHFIMWASKRRESIPNKIAFGIKLTKHNVAVKRPSGRNLRGLRIKQAWTGVTM